MNAKFLNQPRRGGASPAIEDIIGEQGPLAGNKPVALLPELPEPCVPVS